MHQPFIDPTLSFVFAMVSVAWIYLTNFFVSFTGAFFFRSFAAVYPITIVVHWWIMWWWMIPMVLVDEVIAFNFLTIIPVVVGTILGTILFRSLDSPRFIDFGVNMVSWRLTVFNSALLIILGIPHFVWDELTAEGGLIRLITLIPSIIVYVFLYFSWTYLKIWKSYPDRLNKKRMQYTVIFLGVSNLVWVLLYTVSLEIVDDTELSFISFTILSVLQLVAGIIFAWIINADKETKLIKESTISSGREKSYFSELR